MLRIYNIEHKPELICATSRLNYPHEEHFDKITQIEYVKGSKKILIIFNGYINNKEFTTVSQINPSNSEIRHLYAIMDSTLIQIGAFVVNDSKYAYVAFPDGRVFTISTTNGELRQILPASSHQWSALTLSKDGKTLYLGNTSGYIYRLRENGKLEELSQNARGILRMQISDDESTLWHIGIYDMNMTNWEIIYPLIKMNIKDKTEEWKILNVGISDSEMHWQLNDKGDELCIFLVNKDSKINNNMTIDASSEYWSEGKVRFIHVNQLVSAFHRKSGFTAVYHKIMGKQYISANSKFSLNFSEGIKNRVILDRELYHELAGENSFIPDTALGMTKNTCLSDIINGGIQDCKIINKKIFPHNTNQTVASYTESIAKLNYQYGEKGFINRSGDRYVEAHIVGGLTFYAIEIENLQDSKRIVAYNTTLPNHITAGGSFIGASNLVFTCSKQGSVTLWDADRGKPILNWLFFENGHWLVMDEFHRFDTSNIDALEGVHWINKDHPFTPVPFDSFMRDYYQPRLAEMVMQGAALPEVPDLSTRNTYQHEMEIVNIHPSSARGVDVEVRVGGISPKQPITDIKLFRDKQLVAQIPGGKSLKVDSKGTATVFFKNIPLPQRESHAYFRAYGFNTDRVRSKVAEKMYAYTSAYPDTARKVYVLSMGVNQFDNAAWDLRYAVNDAQGMATSLTQALKPYVGLATQRLTSADGDTAPTKANMAQAFSVLSPPGSRTGAKSELSWPGPDDVLVVNISTHGITDNHEFYIVPQDIPGNSKKITPDLVKASVSMNELTHWFRNIQAGEIILTLDTCQSGASVGGRTFKPGPMGDRGFGQLAYDKGMRVICATNEDNAALEFDSLGHGLLSYSLLEGLDDFIQGRTKSFSTKQWLITAKERAVPIYKAIRDGKPLSNDRGIPISLIKTGPKPELVGQEPSLFDFGGKVFTVNNKAIQ
jgi:hypothetical protein